MPSVLRLRMGLCGCVQRLYNGDYGGTAAERNVIDLACGRLATAWRTMGIHKSG
jgi:hypothetical protein